jgi:hypothetical protein
MHDGVPNCSSCSFCTWNAAFCTWNAALVSAVLSHCKVADKTCSAQAGKTLKQHTCTVQDKWAPSLNTRSKKDKTQQKNRKKTQ